MNYFPRPKVANDIVEETHSKALTAIATDGVPFREQGIPCPGIPMLRTILKKPAEIRTALLGEFGDRLFDLASRIDLTHPDVSTNSMLDGVLGGDMSDKVNQLFTLYEYAVNNKLTSIFPAIVKAAGIHTCGKCISTKPWETLVRLLPTREERDAVRKTKDVREIRLGYYLKKGESIWNSLPSTFDMFVRHSILYKEEIDKARKKAEKFTALGCVSMANVVLDSIATFSEKIEDSHYGFHRMTLANAAIIAAKMYKFQVSFKTPETIKITKDFFGYDLHPCKGDIVLAKRGDNKYARMVGNLSPSLMDYTPRVYPACKFDQQRMLKVIDRLEAFPEAEGKALFDHYLVVVPSIKCPKGLDNKFGFYEVNSKSLNSFKNEKEANEKLDVYLMKAGIIHPILMGEKDGKCYFISYFL